MKILFLFLLAVSLSIDAFSLSLAYGMLGINKKKMILISLTVGVFHFIMPILGNFLGSKINIILNIKSKYILLIAMFIILIEIIKSLNEKEKVEKLNLLKIILFAFSVSIDSFALGIGINYITQNLIIASSIFSIISFSFTYVGFVLGKYVSLKFKKISKYISIIILFILTFYICFLN